MSLPKKDRHGAVHHPKMRSEDCPSASAASTHPALAFLMRLDPSPDAKFNIECYSDVPKGGQKPKPDPLSRQLPGLSVRDVSDLLPTLADFNKRGAGIFIARNEFAGPRRAASVKRIRGIHADMDGVTLEQLSRVTEKLKPSIRVQTSDANRLQLYWCLAPDEVLTPDETKKINKALVQHGADPAAVDVSRLLRLPGFRHMKYRAEKRTPVVTTLDVGPSYSADKIRATWPPVKDETKHKRKAPLEIRIEMLGTSSSGLALISEPETPRSVANARAMLASIDADCDYDKYRDIVWSVASTSWECTYELLCAWSRSAPHRFNEDTLRELIQSFDPTKGIGFGTLVYHAREAGWCG